MVFFKKMFLLFISTLIISSAHGGCEKEAPDGCGKDHYCDGYWNICSSCEQIKKFCNNTEVLDDYPDCEAYCVGVVQERKYRDLETRYTDLQAKHEYLQRNLTEALELVDAFRMDWLHITLFAVFGVSLLTHVFHMKIIRTFGKRILESCRKKQHENETNAEGMPLIVVVPDGNTASSDNLPQDGENHRTRERNGGEDTPDTQQQQQECNGSSLSLNSEERSEITAEDESSDHSPTSTMQDNGGRLEPSAPPLNQDGDTPSPSASGFDVTPSENPSTSFGNESASGVASVSPGSTPPSGAQRGLPSKAAAFVHQPTTEDPNTKPTYALPKSSNDFNVTLHSVTEKEQA